MDTYPCPNCGGVADETGCHRCGRAHDPVAARLYKLREAMADLDDESRRLDADRSELDQRRERLRRQRQELTRAIAQRLADERAQSGRAAGAATPGGSTGAATAPGGSTGAATAPAGSTGAATAAAGSTGAATAPGGGGSGRAAPPVSARRTPPVTTVAQPTSGSPTIPAQTAHPADDTAAIPTDPPAGTSRGPGDTRTLPPPYATGRVPSPRPPSGPPRHPAETTQRSAQNTQLTIGGVLLAIAAIVVAGLYYTTTASGERAAVLGLATTVFLGVPVVLTRNTLVATAETIASIGLLLVLLDGFTAYKANFAGIGSVSAPLYAAILFALVTGVAAAYRFATHLRAPQFAALLTVQPLLPLIARNFHFVLTGYAAIFAVVAAFNLGAVMVLGLQLAVLAAGRFRPGQRSSTVDSATGVTWPRMLREMTWVMFGLSLATAVALAADGLLRASTAGQAVPAALALVLAAAIGLAAGQVQADDRVRVFAGGAATLAIIAAVSRVNYLALPDFTLVLTAALAAAVALAARALPESGRRGPQWGAVVAAAFAATVVVGETARATVAVISTTTNPAAWSADLGRFATRTQVTTWQVPLAALLLALFAVLIVPRGSRTNAAVLGGAVVLLALPGAGGLAWWVPSMLAAAVAIAANVMSLYSRRGPDALVRSATAALVGFYAIAASLSRPGLTALVCALLALAAGATVLAVARAPEQFGPFRDRVSDSAFGALAFTLPIAIGTSVWLAGASVDVVLSITMVITALAVVGAAVSQVAARVPRTASAGGALTASVGGLVFCLLLPGIRLLDTGVAILIVTAAAATTMSRMFEVSNIGAVDVIRDLPAAVTALEESIAGHPEVNDRPRRRRRSIVDSPTLSASLATAALIVALARLAATIVPGIGLVTTEAMVLLTALAVRTLPEVWRRGPRIGGVVVGAVVAIGLAAVAIVEAARAVGASTPFWHADLAGWTQRVSASTPYGWQVPVGLTLTALAIWALLPPPFGEDLGYVTFCLAALSLPATFGLLWWAPVLIAGALAVITGLGAALVAPGPVGRPTAVRRLVLAFVLGVYAGAVAGATPTSTGLLLGVYVAAGVAVASVAHLRRVTPIVAGTAIAAALAAAPGAAATITTAGGGANASAVLAAALVVAAFGIPITFAVRSLSGGVAPAIGVGAAGVVTSIAAVLALPAASDAQTWAAAAALISAAAVAAGVPSARDTRVTAGLHLAAGEPAADESTVEIPRRRRLALVAIVLAVLPSVTIAAVASAPAWVAALAGPYRTLRDVWHGYGAAPTPRGAGSALVTLLLLSGVAAIVALVLGGRRFVLAAVLPPLAAMAVVAPAAIGAPAGATSWVALGVAVVTGLGAALSPPVLPSAAHLLRGTAGIVCAVTGGAGFAGSLATPGGTLVALAVVVAAAATAALVGRDPNARMVAWFVAAAAAFAFPVTALSAVGGQLRTGAFYVLAICGVLSGTAWRLARSRPRRGEASVIELAVALGATFALMLTLSSPRHAAAVLTIWGLLLGVTALRRDRPAHLRRWLVRGALVAELFAAWVLLYSVRVPLTEAYTLPFAAVALVMGALELRHDDRISSWYAYGPALVGGFAPSVVLVLIGHDAVARWVTLLVVGVVTVIIGARLRLSAPVQVGSAVAVVVALVEAIRLLARGEIAGGLLVAIAGAVLVGFGAVSERRRRSRVQSLGPAPRAEIESEAGSPPPPAEA